MPTEQEDSICVWAKGQGTVMVSMYTQLYVGCNNDQMMQV